MSADDVIFLTDALNRKNKDPCFFDGHLMDKGWYSGLRKEEHL